jgi:endonuclease G, mitochondrial
MNKLLLFALLLFPLSTIAGGKPCSGKKGGISHCEGSQFVCNNGSISKSTKDCSRYITGNSTQKAAPESIEPTTAPISQDSSEISKVSDNILKLDYSGFTVWLDCSKRGAIRYQYVAQHDTGNLKRYDKFSLDPKVPAECQQYSSKAYGLKYDRGHQVPANHMDYSALAIKQTNYMTNILPQAANMNRGAWLQTEKITECYRDIAELLVIGGVIWGNNEADDYFLQSHGVRTPDAYWKVIIRGTGADERAIAWIVPNSQDATAKRLDQYLVSVEDIEKVTGEKIPVADFAKHDKLNICWQLPIGCHEG